MSISFRDHVVLSLPLDLHGQKKKDAYSCSWFKISHCGIHFLKPRKQSQNEKERLISLADCRQYTERLFCSVTPNKLQPTPA